MRFAAYRHNGSYGVAASARVDTAFHGLEEDAPGFPGTLDDLVEQGPVALAAAGEALLLAPEIDLAGVTLLPPLARSEKILCIGLNYASHKEETGHTAPQLYPVIFGRYNSSLVGHGAAIVRPRVSEKLDYEGEFVAVIGKGGRDIPRATALDHVVAYSVFNDASVRDYQVKTPQWTIGKNFDGTGAFGPWLVTADEVPAGASGLKIETRLNGDVVQSASTSDMLFDVAQLIAILSEALTLSPGDIIVTGTPAGVGVARKPPLFMKAGDVCEVEVEGLGILRNEIVDQLDLVA